MRVLFSTNCSSSYMSPPILGDEQINCGPDWIDGTGLDGKITTLSTPVGVYDLRLVSSKLYPHQIPDVVACVVDSTWRNMPRNLKAFNCPKILLVADTHHQVAPIVGMLQYASSEPFDRIVFLYNRQHIPFFYLAGFNNLYWLPGLTFPHSDKIVADARRQNKREQHIAFVGQIGDLHQRRKRMLLSLLDSNQPLVIKNINQNEALNFYATSLIGFNCSLNGDLNLRTFEILAAGACLLTDKLSCDAGLDLLLTNNLNAHLYSSSEELQEIAKYAVLTTQDTAKIGLSGSLWFDLNMSENKRREAFFSVVFNGISKPLFNVSDYYSSIYSYNKSDSWVASVIIIYQLIQELHRNLELVRVAFDQSVSKIIINLFQTLPRLSVIDYDINTSADLAIIDKNNSTIASRTNNFWFWNSKQSDSTYLVSKMLEYKLINKTLMFFSKSNY